MPEEGMNKTFNLFEIRRVDSRGEVSGMSGRPDENHAAHRPRFDSVRCSRTSIRSRTNGVPSFFHFGSRLSDLPCARRYLRRSDVSHACVHLQLTHSCLDSRTFAYQPANYLPFSADVGFEREIGMAMFVQIPGMKRPAATISHFASRRPRPTF